MPFWKVINFQPNEVTTRGNVTIYADSKGRLKRVVEGPERSSVGRLPKTKFLSKDNTVYYDDNPEDVEVIKTLPVIDSEEYPRIFKLMDWIHFPEGVTCQILRIYTQKTNLKTTELAVDRMIIQTIFGTNSVPSKSSMKILYDREAFATLQRYISNRRKLTSNQTYMVAHYIEADFDLKKTWLLHYKKPPESWDAQKYIFAMKLRAIMQTDEGRKLFAEIFCRRFKMDLSFEDWRVKIEKSIPETLTKQFHLDMWLLLGKLSPEVRKKLMEAEGEKYPRDPAEESGGFLPPGKEGNIEEAEYQDLCKVCNGTKVFKTKAVVNGVEMDVEVECPACKEKDTQLQQVPKRSIGLRV